MWLEVASDKLASVPGRGKINKRKMEGRIYKDVYTNGYGAVLYKKHAVGSASNNQINPGSYESSQLSDSLSAPSYSERNYTSSTDLCASPYVYGILRGSAQKATNVGIDPLSLRSEDNEACADTPETAEKIVRVEKCRRQALCQKPLTATTDTSHRVKCPEEKWVWQGIKVGRYKLFSKKVPCDGVWWTCDGDPDVCPLIASHVPANEKSWESKYVSPDGSVSQYPPTDDTPDCPDCTSHCSSPCSCSNSGTCNGSVASPPPPHWRDDKKSAKFVFCV